MKVLLKRVSVYTDGGSRGNPGPAAIGILIYSPGGRRLSDHREFIGRATNNQAEYRAVLRALGLAGEFTRGRVSCYSDSKLLVNQLSGRFRVRSRGIREILVMVRKAEKAFSGVSYTHLPRTNPRMRLADALVNRALDEKQGRRRGGRAAPSG
jgi:ribonuclease HI